MLIILHQVIVWELNSLLFLVFTSLLGALITFLFRIEPKGKSLEQLGNGKPTFNSR